MQKGAKELPACQVACIYLACGVTMCSQAGDADDQIRKEVFYITLPRNWGQYPSISTDQSGLMKPSTEWVMNSSDSPSAALQIHDEATSHVDLKERGLPDSAWYVVMYLDETCLTTFPTKPA